MQFEAKDEKFKNDDHEKKHTYLFDPWIRLPITFTILPELTWKTICKENHLAKYNAKVLAGVRLQ